MTDGRVSLFSGLASMRPKVRFLYFAADGVDYKTFRKNSFSIFCRLNFEDSYNQ